jgi:hypothetical protein
MPAAKPEEFSTQSKACTIHRFHQEFLSNIFQPIGSLIAMLVFVEITESLPFASCMAPHQDQRRMPDYKCIHEYLCICIVVCGRRLLLLPIGKNIYGPLQKAVPGCSSE